VFGVAALLCFAVVGAHAGAGDNSQISRKTTEDIAKMANDMESEYTCKKPIRLFSTCDFDSNPLMEVQKDNNGMTTVHLEKEKHKIMGIIVSENCVVNVYQHAFKHDVSIYGTGSKNAGLLLKGPKRMCVGKAIHKVKTITIEDNADAGTLANKMDKQNTEVMQNLNTFQTNLKITMAKLKGEVQAQKIRVTSKGPKGATGHKGPRGDAGINGKDGETGVTGDEGFDGETGDTGATGIRGNVGAAVTGPRGYSGATGSRGVRGIEGVTGAKGLDGVTGPTGVAPTGPRGHTGHTGATGIAKAATGPALKFTKRAKEIYHSIITKVRNSLTGATGSIGSKSKIKVGKAPQLLTKNNHGRK